MRTNTIILAGTVVVEGTAFRWWVVDGVSQHLGVSHRILGTKTQPLVGSPDRQAREVGRAMLRGDAPFFDVDRDYNAAGAELTDDDVDVP